MAGTPNLPCTITPFKNVIIKKGAYRAFFVNLFPNEKNPSGNSVGIIPYGSWSRPGTESGELV